MIRVLNVLGTITKGGTEKVIENIYNNIDSSKVVAYIAYHKLEEGYNGDECLTKFQKFKIPLYNMVNALSYRKWWIDFLETHHFDIVHIHYRDSAFLYLDLFHKMGAKSIIHCHNTRRKPQTIGNYISRFNSFFSRFGTDYVLACSKQAAIETVGKKRANSPTTHILHNGCDLSLFNYNPSIREKKRKELNISDKLVLGHIGRFSYQKNHEFLIKVFSEVHKMIPNSVLLLIGNGNDQQNIEKQVKELNLESLVFFLGLRDDIPELLNAMDIFVFPSHFEGLGNVLIEAQATGLRIVASEAIQPEADMGIDLLKKLPLENGPKQWAECIMKEKDYIREDGSSAVKENGFDEKDIAIWVANFLYEIVSKE